MAPIPPPLDEFGLIARYFAPLARHEPGAFGLTDDAAVLGLAAGERLVVTTDAMVAGVHFPANDPPAAIARKLLRVNLSDLAAMGARPRAYTLAAVLPRDTDESWIAEFAAGQHTAKLEWFRRFRLQTRTREQERRPNDPAQTDLVRRRIADHLDRQQVLALVANAVGQIEQERAAESPSAGAD